MNVQTLVVKGRRMVQIPERQYRELIGRAEQAMPSLPGKLPSGNYPAREYLRASIARDIVRTRQRLGLSQAELARRAGLAIAHLNRLERGNGNPTASTIEKIDKALNAAEKASA
ncbi:MAG: helix-turn-helix domain-containing protein [Phycisphaerae bacterium]